MQKVYRVEDKYIFCMIYDLLTHMPIKGEVYPHFKWVLTKGEY